MGMGYAADYVDEISFDDVQELCPKEADAFLDVLENHGLELDEVADNLRLDDTQYLEEYVSDVNDEPDKAKEIAAETVKAYEDLQKAFAEATRVGDSHLELRIDYHNDEEGSRYDDVRGTFWAVDGMYDLSPAGKNLKDKVQRQHFVTFG